MTPASITQRCRYAQWRPSEGREGCEWCLEMDVPCSGSVEGADFKACEMFCFDPLCLWEIYQSTGKVEDMMHWLKHQAYERMVGECLEGLQ